MTFKTVVVADNTSPQSVWDTKYSKGGCCKVCGDTKYCKGAATKCVGIQNISRGLLQSVWGYKILQGGCHKVCGDTKYGQGMPHFVPTATFCIP